MSPLREDVLRAAFKRLAGFPFGIPSLAHGIRIAPLGRVLIKEATNTFEEEGHLIRVVSVTVRMAGGPPEIEPS